MPSGPISIEIVETIHLRSIPATADDQTIDLRDRRRATSPSQKAETVERQAGDAGEILLYPVKPVRPYLSARIAVRTLDLTVSILALLVLWPLMAAIAIAVKIESTGPVFYGSPRLGHKTATFTAWKFRSMRPDADVQLQALLASSPAAKDEYLRYHKLKNDPRLTGIGKIIRRTSLDELPQLINILMGEMSVVGPRPNLIDEADLFGQALPVVLQVRPGLTGLWQVSGRNRLPVQERVVLDLDYARNRTLGGDLAICGRTFLQLWRPGKHGAY